MSSELIFILSYLLIICSAVTAVFLDQPVSDFSKHSIVQPTVQHARTKRQIVTTRDENGAHHAEVTMTIVVDGEEYILDLRMNQDLITDNHVLSYQNKGKTILYKPKKEEIELCQYSGSVRGKANSWVALSTCDGVQGVVFDGNKMRYIEPAQGSNISSKHYVYDHEDFSKRHQCGHVSNMTNNSAPKHHEQYIMDKNIINRFKRYASDTNKLHEPYNANKQSRYVELVLVADNTEFRTNRNDLHAVHRRMKTLANIINAIYSPLNIFIALVGVVVWTESDQIQLVPDGDITLKNFLNYRERVLITDIPNDNAHLITHQKFTSSVIGKAPIEAICTRHSSGGVENMHSSVMGQVASTIAHEMGHNFGMEHDTGDHCDCPDRKCIMSSSSTSVIPIRWSSCSLNSLALTFGKGNDYCLSNKPKRLFYSSMCGNGFVEPDEECDCGTMAIAGTLNPCHACCEPSTCKLRANATCGSGICCDLQTCRPKSAGTVCRSADRECDLPEYCTGHSEYCPDDVYKMDTTPCGKSNESAYCISGKCRSHTSQCRLLWGPTSENGHRLCYEQYNKQGTKYGHCGYSHVDDRYKPCKDEHVLCGMLKCFHLTGRPQIMTKMTYTMGVTIDDTVRECHGVDVSIQYDDINLSMVPDGAKCGKGKMCLKQQCVSVVEVRKKTTNAISSVCPSNCSGHGVCNSAGHCHCESGFAPPLCAEPGNGGSYESSPITDPAGTKKVMIAIYAIFLGIVPSVLLVIILMHYLCPKTLLHCCGVMRKLETYCNLKRTNTEYLYAIVNKRETNETGHKFNNIKTSTINPNQLLGQTEYVNIQPIYANNKPTYSNYNDNILEKAIDSNPLRKINKDDIHIVSDTKNTKTTNKTIYKDDIQVIRNEITKDNIVIPKEMIKCTPTTRKMINTEEIQVINTNKEKDSSEMDNKNYVKDNIFIASERIKDKNLQTAKKKITKDDIQVVKKDKNSTQKTTPKIVKNNNQTIKDHVIDIAQDLQVPNKKGNKADVHTAIEKINRDHNQGAGQTKTKGKSSATKSIDNKNKPLIKSTQNEGSLPKENKTGVSVKELASVINDMTNDISIKGDSGKKNIGVTRIAKTYGLKKQ